MKALHGISHALLWIGGLNWLVFGLFQWDIGQLLGGMDSILSRTVYVLVGLATLVTLFTHASYCKYCAKQQEQPKPMM